MLAQFRSRLTYANVMATIAVFIALGGGAYAAVKLPANSVGTKQLKNRSVTSKKIANGAVNSAKVAANSLTGKNINVATLGKVPAAAAADNAEHALAADSATTAGHATAADSATTAGSATPNGVAGGGLSGSYPNPTLAAPEAFHEVGAPGEPAFHSPWTNFGGSFTTAGFYKDPLGIVHLKGAVDGTTTGIVFTLPASYAPAHDVMEGVGRDTGGFLVEICGTLQLDGCGSAGNVTVVSSSASNNVYLDGVTFRAGE